MRPLVTILTFLISPILTQYYTQSMYSGIGGVGTAVPKQQTILVPVYSQGMLPGYGGYPGYGYGYGSGYGSGYGGGGGMMMMPPAQPCCGYGGAGYGAYGGSEMMMMPKRESNAKKFLRGATEGVFMGSVGMLGFRK